MVVVLLTGACGPGRAQTPVTPPEPDAPADAPTADATPAADDRLATWQDLREAVAATICARTVELPDRDPITIPSYGDREACGLPEPATALERAALATLDAAKPVLISLRDERDAAFEAVKLEDPEARTAALREAYLTPAWVDVLLRRSAEALAAEGLRCPDCPQPAAPPRVEITWARFEPYFLAHVWPDPVVTPPEGEAKLSLHICGGINGIAQLDDPDPLLVRAGYLGAIHSQAVFDRVRAFLESARTDAELASRPDDAAKTAWLREHVGPFLLAEPGVRTAVCESLARFEADTGVVVSDCQPP